TLAAGASRPAVRRRRVPVNRLTGAVTMHVPSTTRDVTGSLASVGIFRDLDPVILHSIEQELQWLTLDAGETLIRQGAAGDSLFVVMSGRLGAFVERTSGEEVTGE